MSIVIGTLTIDLKANTAEFSEGMEKMSRLTAKNASDIKRSLEKLALVAAGAFAAVAAETTEMIKGTLEAADAMARAARSAGTTITTYSTLAYAAGLVDVSHEELTKGLEKLSVAMFKAQNGNVQLARMFDRLKISTKDANGHLKDSGVMLEELAIKFSKLNDGPGKTAFAKALLGREGGRLIPFLNEYGEKQKEVNEEAHRFGLALSTSTGEVVERAHIKLKKVEAAFQGMGFVILSQVLPALEKLIDKFLDFAQSTNLPDLAKKFGDNVVKAITFTGQAMEFTAKHATELKDALIALAAVKVTSMALPIVADLMTVKGGAGKTLGKGFDKFTMGALGMEHAAEATPKIGGAIRKSITGYYGAAKGASVSEIAGVAGFTRVEKALVSIKAVNPGAIFKEFLASLAAMPALIGSGIGKLPGLVAKLPGLLVGGLNALPGLAMSGLRMIPTLLNGIVVAAANAGRALMLAALSNPWTAVALAIGALILVCYKFRNTTFHIGKDAYEVRDIWNAAWIVIKKAIGATADFFVSAMNKIKDVWTSLVNHIKNNSIVKALDLGGANDRMKGYLGTFIGKITPTFFHKALDEAKEHRLAEAGEKKKEEKKEEKDKKEHKPGRDDLDTTGLDSSLRDPYGDEMKKLKLAIDATQAYIDVLGGNADAVQKVTLEQKANTVVLEMEKQLRDSKKPAMSGKEKEDLRQRVMDDERLKTDKAYGDSVQTQMRTADLNIQQQKLVAAATLEGDSAVRRASVDNALLALRYNRTADELKMLDKVLPDVTRLLEEQSSVNLAASVNKEIDSLHDQTEAQENVTAALLGTIDTQRAAELANKTHRIDDALKPDAITPDADRKKLREQKDAIEANTRATYAAQDAERALSLLSPAERYEKQKDAIEHAAKALMELNRGSLTYGETLELEAQEMDAFNKATQEQADLLLKVGSSKDGIRAFFLEMSEQAQSSASIVHDSFKKAFDGIADQLTELSITGTQSFGKMFEDIGRQMLNATFKKAMQESLASLGDMLGGPKKNGSATGDDKKPGLLGTLGGMLGGVAKHAGGKMDGSSKERALWVRSADAAQALGGGPSTVNSGSDTTDGDEQSPMARLKQVAGKILHSIGGVFKKLFHRGDSGDEGDEGDSLSSVGATSIGGITSALGLGGKPDGTQTNPFYVQMSDKPLGGIGGIGGNGVVGDLTQSLLGVSTGKADGSQGNPFYTKSADKSGGNGLLGGLMGGDSGGSDSGGGWSGFLKGLFGGGSGGGAGDGGTLAGGMGLADGGHVRGPGSATSDSIDAKLSDGEFVVNARATAKHLPLLHSINKDKSVHVTTSREMPSLAAIRRFAEGGLVSPTASANPYVGTGVSAAYTPGETNTVMMGAASSHAASASTSNTSQRFGEQHFYTIDARGTDPALTEQRVRAAIRASHDSSVITSLKGQAEAHERMPHR